MKTKTQSVVNNQRFENLLKETPETVATNIACETLDGKIKNFTIIDLWGIEKNKRSTRNVRRWLN